MIFEKLFPQNKTIEISKSLTAVNELVPVDNGWLSTGEDPYFIFKHKFVPGSWYRIVLSIDFEVSDYCPKVYFDYGNGFSEEYSYIFPLTSGGKTERLLFFERNPMHSRLDPFGTKGEFKIDSIELAAIGDTEAVDELYLALCKQHPLYLGMGRADIERELANEKQDKTGLKIETDIVFDLYNSMFVERGFTPKSYTNWINSVELDANVRIEATLKVGFSYEPLISILVPVYNPDIDHLRAMFESVVEQSYENWQLCLVDDASTNGNVRLLLEKFAQSDDRITLKIRKSNGHICKASNDALQSAKGDFCVLLDHDDRLHVHAIAHLVAELNREPSLKIVYTDEDKIDEEGVRFDPHFKSDWNRDLLYSHNYVSHLGMYCTELLRRIGGFRVGYEGSQDYDLLLRCVENCSESQISHIPYVLYHWRAAAGSTALGAGEKDYTQDSGKMALENHFARLGEDAVVEIGSLPNTYRTRRKLQAHAEPSVTLLVPTRDGVELLRNCVSSILERTLYSNYNILILDNQSCERETKDYFSWISEHPKVNVLRYDYPFNFSAINNYGVAHSTSELVGLINNDIEVIEPNWLIEMVGNAIRPGIGCVGAKLLYPNDTIQHAGIILGVGGIAGHSHKYFDRNAYGYFSRLMLAQNLSAVTAATLLIRRKVYLEVGGLTETLAVAFNDVDFCLKVKRAGYNNFWTPHALLYHHESVSRGSDEHGEKKLRFDGENKWMRQQWGHELDADIFYNRNLTRVYEDFSIG